MSPRPDPKAREQQRLWLLAIGIRHRWDMWVTGMRGRLTFYGGVMGLAIGVLGVVTAPATWDWVYLTGLAGFALSVVLFVVEIIRLRRSEIALVKVQMPVVTRNELGGGTVVRLAGTEDRPATEVGVVWDEVDVLLPESPAVCQYTRIKKGLPARTAPYAYSILRIQAETKRFFNGGLIRQDDDLTVEMLTGAEPVRLRKTDYFNMICSNYLTGWRVLDRRTGAVTIDGAELFLRNGELLPLSVNHQSNGIGVSTLAFTADGKMVLSLQGARSASSPGLLAPAGSGSVDLRDVPRLRRDRSLVGFVACAMQRELVEESNVRYRDIEWTEVLGYFRWLNMGGKPEYVGVTKLKLSSDELVGRDVRLVETPFVQRLDFECPLDLALLRADPEALAALDERHRGLVSMPLFMCLRALGRALARDDQLGQQLSSLAPAA